MPKESYKEFKATFGMSRKEVWDMVLHATATLVAFALFMSILLAIEDGRVSVSAAALLLIVCTVLVLFICFNPPLPTSPRP